MPDGWINAIRRANRSRLARLRQRSALIRKPSVLGVMEIIKNESANIQEWIEHYLWQGAGKIYLIDNGSTDNTLAKVAPFVTSGQVSLTVRPGKWQQAAHYWAAFRQFNIARDCEWLTVADIDEYWFFKDGRRPSDVIISDYISDLDLIYSNWAMLGNSGHLAQPHSIRRAMVMRLHELAHYMNRKWMCRTARITSGNAISGVNSARVITDTQNLQINHYIVQSRDYFQAVKMTRGDAMSRFNETVRDMACFDGVDAAAMFRDELLASMVAARA